MSMSIQAVRRRNRKKKLIESGYMDDEMVEANIEKMEDRLRNAEKRIAGWQNTAKKLRR